MAPSRSTTDSAADPASLIDGWCDMLQRERIFFRIDAKDRLLVVSPSVQEQMGYDADELVGRDYHDYFDVDHPLLAKFLDASGRFIQYDPPGLRRSIGRKHNGELIYLILREQPTPSEDGPATDYMAEDLTVRVQAVLTMQDSERRYHRLVEGLRNDYIIYSRDAEGRITYVSPSTKNILGYEPEQMIGVYARDTYADPAVGRELIDKFIRDAEAGRRAVHTERIEVRHHNGSVRVMEIDEWPVFNDEGRITSVEGISKDVTEADAIDRRIRRSNEDLERRVAFRTGELTSINEELRANEARYRDVIETLNDFIVRWKPSGVRTFVNEAFCRFHNLQASDLVGTSFVPQIHPDTQSIFHAALDSITPQNPSVNYEIRVARRDGSWPWVQWNTRAKFTPEGEIAEYQSVGRDVTALKAAADLLRQKEAHLAHLSRLATMGEMVAGIAHEINQPLHAAKTFAEAARRNLQTGGPGKVEKAIECAEEISQAITRTVGIIRRLREFTKSQPFELEAFQINCIVKEATELAGYVIRRTSAVVRLQLAENSPTILGDRIQLEQLVVNLIINACEAMEHTPADERVITVRTRVKNKQLVLSVVDAGSGVDDAGMIRLFEAFFTTKQEGMGMGLVLCKSIAEAHGGDLRAERNADGPGMTFILTLPISGDHS
ncbi:PAS domain S-box protein [Lacipirellula sp.]|uniref:PAS domain S-box protein n=1 Tax=Lacipirellula sp. TaxID=2691419 RepID=UPI003D0EAB27